MSSITHDLIEIAYKRFIEELPQLEKLKLVARLELRGRGDVQIYRISAPGPEITKGEPDDSRIEISVRGPTSMTSPMPASSTGTPPTTTASSGSAATPP